MDLAGRILGHYQILARLGKGGMGEVYLAEHMVIGRKAAIKVLHEGIDADTETVAQFFDEARAANQVKHTGIVDIYDCGHDDALGPYLVMEYLEGESLGELLRREGAVAAPEAARIVAGVADVLEAVHERSIVHRDLKPDNIFLTNEGRIEVLDFGVAQLALGRKDAATPAWRIMGTPHYMSPEQCAGAPALDHLTDIYSLGVICYEMLTGLPPFDNRDHRKIMAMHQGVAPPPPSAINPVITRPVEQVVLKAMAKSPGDRFETAWAFAAEFARVTGVKLPERTVSETGGGRRVAPSLGRDTLRDPVPPTAAAPVAFVRRRCPQCPDKMLKPVRFGDVELDVCPECRGVWFDQGEELETARQSMGEDPRIREVAAELGHRVRVTAMRCPCCEEPLVTYQFPQLDDLEAEVCELCAGVWLEHGEVAHVQRSRAQQLVRRLTGKGEPT